jgi:hypothetical protein
MPDEQKSAPSWLPVERAVLVLAVILVGLQQAYVGNREVLLWWLFLPLLSPRLMAKHPYVGFAIALVGCAALFWGIATAPPRPIPTAEELRQRLPKEQMERYLCRVAGCLQEIRASAG